MRNSRQSGFTLTELMISIMLGMSVIGSVLLGYLATYSGSLSTLANSKLNQEMTSLMNLMVEDIRRAGYNGTVLTDPTTNNFSQFNNTALAIFDNMTANNQILPAGLVTSGTCILYSYDLDGVGTAGTAAAAELFGFRRNAGVVEMRRSGNPAAANTCNGDSITNWQPLTDAGFMSVTALTFDLAAFACLNAGEPDGAEDGGNAAVADDPPEFNCYVIAPDTGNVTVETREIQITLTANLADDAFVEMTKTQTVRVRNDMVRRTP